jgi:hypothetical protein
VERLRAVAARVLSGLSAPGEEVAERIRTEFREYEADGLVQAWFSQAPLVRASDGMFLAAPHPFLRLAAAAGAFYRALTLAREHAEQAGSLKPWTNAHSSEMGRRFETFTSRLLEKARSPGDEVAGEYSYLKGQEALSPDFLITNTLRPREVLLVQAKLKRLVPGAFYGFSAEDFRGDATGALAELVWKTLRYVYRVETTPDARLDDAHRPLHDLIRQAETIGLLGVLPAMPSLFHVKEFRDLVLAGVHENLKAKERAWLEKSAQRFSLWHIFDTEELCAFIAARTTSDESLLGALRIVPDAAGLRRARSPRRHRDVLPRLVHHCPHGRPPPRSDPGTEGGLRRLLRRNKPQVFPKVPRVGGDVRTRGTGYPRTRELTCHGRV